MRATKKHGGTGIRRVRLVLVAGGVLAMAAGLIGTLTDPGAGLGALIFMAAVLVLHDGVFLPLVSAVGRWVPATAGVVCLAVAVVGVPLALGFGKAADNASVLPLAYPRNLGLILGAVVLAAIGKGMVRRWRARRG